MRNTFVGSHTEHHRWRSNLCRNGPTLSWPILGTTQERGKILAWLYRAQVWVKSFGGGGNEPKLGGSKPWLNRAAWNRQGFGAPPMSNTRLTVVALLSRPSYLPSPPTNGRTDGRTQGRTCPPTRRKRAFDRRWKGVWRRRQNTGKKERVCDRRRHRRRRTSFCGDQRKVRASVCVFCAGQQ